MDTSAYTADATSQLKYQMCQSTCMLNAIRNQMNTHLSGKTNLRQACQELTSVYFYLITFSEMQYNMYNKLYAFTVTINCIKLRLRSSFM